MLYTIANFTTQCGENRRTDIANFINTHKQSYYTVWRFLPCILYGNYYPSHREFELICIGKFARRTWVNFTQQSGKNRHRCQQHTFYYSVWQLLLYFYREFFSQKFSPCSIYNPDHAFNSVDVARHYWDAATRNSCAWPRNCGGETQFLGKSFPYKPDIGTTSGLYCIFISQNS